MKCIYRITTLILLFTLNVFPIAFAEDIPLSYEKAWFKPELLENHDETCNDLLRDATEKFFSKTALDQAYGIAGFGYANNGAVLNWKILGGNNLTEIQAYGKTFYLDHYRYPGCGGACETNQSLVSQTPFPADYDETLMRSLTKDAPPAISYDYMIARNEKDIPYLLVLGAYEEHKDKLFAYRLSEQGRWQKACTISFTPNMQKLSSPESDSAKDAIKLVTSTAAAMRLKAGNCGSISTHWRWGKILEERLEQTLYRPWAVNTSGTYAGNSHGYYKQTIENLQKWSLKGTQAFNNFKNFEEQLPKSINSLATFYQASYKWPQNVANQIAEEAVTSAVSYGFGFYMYSPAFYDQEAGLRTAILNKTPLEAIKKMPLSAAGSGCCGDPTPEDSLLSVAITYPEALQYLLEKGYNPNHQNAFGKTPLMYAAQYNQVESVKLLLKNGANTNLATIIPEDTCYYTLTKSGMTALHYAARYSSKEVIELLLTAGANPLVTTSEKTGGFPYDWLMKYTSSNSEEVNKNIPASDLVIAQKLLALPSEEDAVKIVKALNNDAEKFYADKKLTAAYEATKKALQLKPGDNRALSNMSLIAHKMGKSEVALEATKNLIENGTDKKMIANAWFNYGLICDSTQITYYNGNSYCQYSKWHNYFSAFTTFPTEARKNKLIDILLNDLQSCRFKGGNALVFTGCGQYKHNNQICIIHPKEMVIDTSSFTWKIQTPVSVKQNVKITQEESVSLGKHLSSYPIGENMLSTYHPNKRLGFPIKWDNEICNEDYSVTRQ